MKTKFGLLIMLLLISSTVLPQSNYDFRKTRWGMSVNEVIAAEGGIARWLDQKEVRKNHWDRAHPNAKSYNYQYRRYGVNNIVVETNVLNFDNVVLPINPKLTHRGLNLDYEFLQNPGENLFEKGTKLFKAQINYPSKGENVTVLTYNQALTRFNEWNTLVERKYGSPSEPTMEITPDLPKCHNWEIGDTQIELFIKSEAIYFGGNKYYYVVFRYTCLSLWRDMALNPKKYRTIKK